MPQFWSLLVQDPNSAVKQRALAFPDVGIDDDLSFIAEKLPEFFDCLDSQITITIGNADPKGHTINTQQMVTSPRLIIYVNSKNVSYSKIMQTFAASGVLVDIVNEAEMFKTLFISYGGTDEVAAAAINNFLKSRAIKTWFFPVDALPGEKLHRMMYEGVNQHERVLLICSQGALNRLGVLNELERVLEREATEGGSEILVPVTLDDYVYSEWAPARPDVAAQVRSRVVTRLNFEPGKENELKTQLEKIVKALSKSKP